MKKFEEMEMLTEYARKFGLKEVKNDYEEIRKTRPGSIVFPNGWVASIVEYEKNNGKYSVAMCDYNGYFDWSILDEYGAYQGRFICDTELDIIIACETIRRIGK